MSDNRMKVFCEAKSLKTQKTSVDLFHYELNWTLLHFVKASKTHMLNKLSTVTLITSLLLACGPTFSQNLFFQKMKASHSFHVTLANASGVSKYHTGSLIAFILLYLKILQYAQPADSWALKRLG